MGYAIFFWKFYKEAIMGNTKYKIVLIGLRFYLSWKYTTSWILVKLPGPPTPMYYWKLTQRERWCTVSLVYLGFLCRYCVMRLKVINESDISQKGVPNHLICLTRMSWGGWSKKFHNLIYDFINFFYEITKLNYLDI